MMNGRSRASGTTMTEQSHPRGLVEAFILHGRKYRDTSMIVELFTRDEGRLPAVVRSVRGKKSRIAGYIQPFTRLLVSWYGRGELKTVRTMDFPWRGPELEGEQLLTGLYVNELLVRLVGKYEPLPEVFDAYGPLMHRIGSKTDMPAALRRFELLLLQELGYGITFESEAHTGKPVSADAFYRYVPDEGFHRVVDGVAESPHFTGGSYSPNGVYFPDGSRDPWTFKGAQLMAIGEGSFAEPEVDASAKRIIRSSFAALLGERKLKSRELFGKAKVPR